MQIKSILNRIEKMQGFVYGITRWCLHNGRQALEITILVKGKEQADLPRMRKETPRL